MSQRFIFILMGLAGGFAAWALTELFDDYLEALWGGRPLLVLVLFTLILFATALAILGELGLRRTLVSSGGLALAVSLLALWKSLGFDTAGQMLERGHAIAALLVLGTVPVPFLVALKLEGRAGWRDYRVLFVESWNIVVRQAAAWLFVGVVWVVLLLSVSLLDLVGLRAFSELIGEPLTIWLVTGAAWGLGLAVVTEMPEVVSPYLLVRLVRLIAPVLMAVVVVFLLMVPLRGLNDLFGSLSAAGILSTVALAAIVLVSIVVDQDDTEATRSGVLRWSARGLALMLPVLAGLAVWAVALRVRDYGWTPNRVSAAAGVSVILGYGVLYLAAVLRGRGWMVWLRRGNIAMALAVIALAILWLTPAISPEAIAVRSQIVRFEAGRGDLTDLPLSEMKADWGAAGARGLEQLAARAAEPGQKALAARLALLEREDARWALRHLPEDAEARRARLAAALRVLPEGAAAPEELLSEMMEFDWRELPELCTQTRPDGLPSCLLYLTDFLPDRPGTDAVLLMAGRGGAGLEVYSQDGTRWQSVSRLATDLNPGEDYSTTIRALLDGQGVMVPSPMMVLKVGDQMIGIQP